MTRRALLLGALILGGCGSPEPPPPSPAQAQAVSERMGQQAKEFGEAMNAKHGKP